MKTMTRNKMKTLPLAALASALLFGAGGVNAADVASQVFQGALNQLSDNSGESQNVDVNGDTFLGVGDTLRGILTIETVENLTNASPTNNLGGGSGNNELTAIFETEVISLTVVSDTDGSCNGNAACDQVGDSLSGDELANYVFGPNAAFIAAGGYSDGTIVAFYDDSTIDYTRSGSQAVTEASATGGTLVLEAGMNGTNGSLDADELWKAFGAPVDTTVLKSVPAGSALGTFNVQLSFVGVNTLFPNFQQVSAGCSFPFSPTAPCGGDGLIDLNGSGSILGTQDADTNYSAFNNVDFTVYVVPAPGVLALFGIGMLGMGFVTRRKTAA
jgi:hypothetical protein